MTTSPLKARVEPMAYWTGSRMLIWGGQAIAEPYQEFHDGATYRP